MSNFTKIFIMLLAWLIFAFVTLKTCIQPTCCASGGEEATEVIPAAVSKDYALATQLNLPEVLQGDLWPDLRSRLLSEYEAKPEQELEIYGNYFPDEPTPAGYESMGFYRAELIRKMLAPDIPTEQMRILSNRLDKEKPSVEETWDAATFSWHEKDQVVDIIEIDNEITVRFPYNSNAKEADPAIDAYLLRLAQRLEQTNELVSITGHTDNIGGDEFNMALGQRRADFLRDILLGHGVDAARISTRSEGRSNPVDSNSTEKGRQNNRRAVVKLTPAN